VSARSERIEAAVTRAKMRDGWKCRVCNRAKKNGYVVEGAHLLPRRAPFPWYHADDERWIVTLCTIHHMSFGHNHDPMDLAKWLHSNGLHEEGTLIEQGMNGELHGALNER
jgi:hypothetical protein